MPKMIDLILDFALLNAFTSSWAEVQRNLIDGSRQLIFYEACSEYWAPGYFSQPKVVVSTILAILLLFPNGVEPAELIVAWTELPQHQE